MKKGLFLSLLVASGAAAYYVIKKLELKIQDESLDEDVKLIKMDDDYSEEVKSISGLYPYLSKKFIEKILNKNDQLNEEYPEGSLVEIKHTLEFKDASMVENFIEIMEHNGYEVVSNENNIIVIFKNFYSKIGKIISEIYNVSNQVKYLNGSYNSFELEAKR